MLVTTIELPPGHVPLLRPTVQEGADMFSDALTEALSIALAKNTPEFNRILTRFATGKHVVFMTLHTEPALSVGGD